MSVLNTLKEVLDSIKLATGWETPQEQQRRLARELIKNNEHRLLQEHADHNQQRLGLVTSSLGDKISASFTQFTDTLKIRFNRETTEEQKQRKLQAIIDYYQQRIDAVEIPVNGNMQEPIQALNKIAFDEMDLDPENPLKQAIPELSEEQKYDQNEIENAAYYALSDAELKLSRAKQTEAHFRKQYQDLTKQVNNENGFFDRYRRARKYGETAVESEASYKAARENFHDKVYAHKEKLRQSQQLILRAGSPQKFKEGLEANNVKTGNYTSLNEIDNSNIGARESSNLPDVRAPWFELNKKINVKRTLAHEFFKLEGKIAKAKSINELNVVFKAHSKFEEIVKDLSLDDQQKYRLMIYNQFLTKIAHIYRVNSISNLNTYEKDSTDALYSHLLFLNINRAPTEDEKLNSHKEKIIINDLFNADGQLNTENLYQQLLALDFSKLTIDELKSIYQLTYLYFSKSSGSSLHKKIYEKLSTPEFAKAKNELFKFKTLLNYLKISAPNKTLKNFFEKLNSAITDFEIMKGKPDTDDMKKIITRVIIEVLNDPNLTQADIAALFNFLKPNPNSSTQESEELCSAHQTLQMIHTKTKKLALYSSTVTTGTWDNILVLLKNHAALLKIKEKDEERIHMNGIAAEAAGQNLNNESTQVEEQDTTTDDTIQILIDTKRYQLLPGKQEEPAIEKISKLSNASETSSASSSSNNSHDKEANTDSLRCMYSWLTKPKPTSTREMLSLLDTNKDETPAAKQLFEHNINTITSRVR